MRKVVLLIHRDVVILSDDVDFWPFREDWGIPRPEEARVELVVPSSEKTFSPNVDVVS